MSENTDRANIERRDFSQERNRNRTRCWSGRPQSPKPPSGLWH